MLLPDFSRRDEAESRTKVEDRFVFPAYNIAECRPQLYLS